MKRLGVILAAAFMLAGCAGLSLPQGSQLGSGRVECANAERNPAALAREPSQASCGDEADDTLAAETSAITPAAPLVRPSKSKARKSAAAKAEPDDRLEASSPVLIPQTNIYVPERPTSR